MSTTTALLILVGFLLACLVFAICDYRRICLRDTQRTSGARQVR
ncbi:MAG TPA: hypothetical protein VEW07_03495 [Solirubrobacterales bacterium]|nr:hypothetical protein [Solirubrobacterales bacterium]